MSIKNNTTSLQEVLEILRTKASGDAQLEKAAYADDGEGMIKFFVFFFELGMTWEQYEQSSYNECLYGTMFYVQDDGFVYNSSLRESVICEAETGEKVKGTDLIKPIMYINDGYLESDE